MASSRAPKRTVSGLVASPIVKVLVGPPIYRMELLIYKTIIVPRSQFFANALSGRWNSTDDNSIDLHKFDPDIRAGDFQRYLETVYTNEFTPSCDKTAKLEICQALYNTTQNKDENGKFSYPGWCYVKVIYEGTVTATNPMRRLLVYFWYDVAKSERYIECEENLPKAFLLDLVKKPMTRTRSQERPLRYDSTQYMEMEEETKDGDAKRGEKAKVAGDD